MSRWLAGLFVLAVTTACALDARAATIVGVVSEQSAAELSSGAERFSARCPGHVLRLRTVVQIEAMLEPELERLLAGAHAVVLGAVFGEAADRLVPVLDRGLSREATLLALHSDARLMERNRIGGERIFDGISRAARAELTTELGAAEDPQATRRTLTRKYPRQAPWIAARAYWQERGTDNLAALFAWLAAQRDASVQVAPVKQRSPIRWLQSGRIVEPSALSLRSEGNVAVVDYDYGDRSGDRQMHEALCRAFAARKLGCVSVLARWGEPSVSALRRLGQLGGSKISAVVVLQDFVVGGGGGREPAVKALERLDVPVLKAIRLTDRTELEWRQSADGLAHDSVHYRIAMPELQGIGQPAVVAVAGPERVEPATGLRLAEPVVVQAEVEALSRRVARWAVLQRKKNAAKRVAVVYYNHPPGRHNVGADNLDVPASLMEVLRLLERAGYRTGPLPASSEALLERIQERGINLPEDRAALTALATKVETLGAGAYAKWFASLPRGVRAEVSAGPLGALVESVVGAAEGGALDVARERVRRTMADTRHLVEGVESPARRRALDLLEQLEAALGAWTCGGDRSPIDSLVRALEKTNIEGLRGWGPPPGRVMVHDEAILLPGIEFGNVLLAPQPPRGWELDEELLHANLAFPPPHQYLAFYHYVRDVWKADVVVHVGRHSTYEFLPGHQVGLSAEDYPRLMLGDLPSVYLYIVDGVGEGIQAKRRGQAVIVDHLTPSLSTTPLYDKLLELRQLVESFGAAAGQSDQRARRAVSTIRSHIDELEMRKELEASMRGELAVRGIGYEDVDDDLFVHEVGHYLTKLQEQFMPFGLHVFGRDWSGDATSRMLKSMGGDGSVSAAARTALEISPRREQESLLHALEGRFVHPGPGNDPIRTPDALPTGRNFHALDASVIPTPLAFELGAQLAGEALTDVARGSDDAEAVVLWASDTVRDEGAMVAFGLELLGIRPVWNSRGIVQGLKRDPARSGSRSDVTFVTSGLFRDLYPNLLILLDRAARLAIDGSSRTIRKAHPELGPALDAALEPLGAMAAPGEESLVTNAIARHWVERTRELMSAGRSAGDAGGEAAYRVFGNAPGGYGAGVNRLAERSGAWRQRGELAKTYLRRLGHVYGASAHGEPKHASFEAQLSRTTHAYLGRASNLYGLLDNNDGFDYLGGLSLAIESAGGEAPLSRVVQHADPKRASLEALPAALMQELRGRHLNPEYLEGLMQHGYAGARTMGSAFVENLWGWQVTTPEVVEPWVWDEVKSVYLDDRHDIGLDEFLEQGSNVHVKTNILALFLVAAEKGFYVPSAEVLAELAREFAELVAAHGLPGSGHTRPDHPVMDFIRQQLSASDRAGLDAVLERTRMERERTHAETTVSEIEATEAAAAWGVRERVLLWGSMTLAAGLFAAGVRRGREAA